MQNNAPSRSLSCLLLVLAGPFGAHLSLASGQSNVRPVPAIGRVPRAAGGSDAGSREAEEARFLRAPAGQTAPEPAWDVGMEIHGMLQPAADLETALGERSVLRGGWDASLARRRGDRSLELFLDTEASFYDWSATAALPGGAADPFNDLYETRVGALLGFAEDEQVSWFTGMEVVLAGEDSPSIGAALSIGAITGVDVRAGDDLTLSFGLAALTRLEDSTWVLPYLGFDWRLNDTVRLATDGAGVLLEAQLGRDWTATLAAEYELRQFRLNEDNAIPGGVYQDDQITLSGTLDWRVSASATLSLTAGLVAWQESTFLDDGGAKLGEVETDPAPFGAVSLTFGR
jgi:hypothetical protein